MNDTARCRSRAIHNGKGENGAGEALHKKYVIYDLLPVESAFIS